MKPTLKGIHYSAQLSQETSAYTATLYVDGRALASVRNDGHGGSTFVAPLPKSNKVGTPEFDRWTEVLTWAKSLEPRTYTNEGETFTFARDLADWCDEQLEAWLEQRDFKAALKKRALVLVDGRVREYHYTGQREVSPKLLEDVRAKHPGAPVLNDMPEAEAFELWHKHSGVM